MSTHHHRYAIALSYDGSHYHGWQAQCRPPLPTIQETLESSLSRIANAPIRVHCAGRTDAGVHASHQVVHFDSPVLRDEKAWVVGSNSHLPSNIGITWARLVPKTFHARFSATARRYRYLIVNTPVRPALLSHGVTWYRLPLDARVMHTGAQMLQGEHDFSSFRAAACQAHHATRTIHRISVERYADIIVIDVTANAFLHHMVRNIAGVLMTIGCKEQSLDWVRQVLNARDRTLAAMTAPSHGLYLIDVSYPPEFYLPAALPGPYFLAIADNLWT